MGKAAFAGCIQVNYFMGGRAKGLERMTNGEVLRILAEIRDEYAIKAEYAHAHNEREQERMCGDRTTAVHHAIENIRPLMRGRLSLDALASRDNLSPTARIFHMKDKATCNTENDPSESTKTQAWVNMPESENDAETNDFHAEANEHIKRLERQVARLVEKEKMQDKRLYWCERHIDELERRRAD